MELSTTSRWEVHDASLAGPRVRRGRGTRPRFTLANERTFLAWVRTGLAVVALGLAAEALKTPAADAVRHLITACSVLLGSALAGISFLRWTRVERALRLREPLPGHAVAPVLSVALALCGCVALVGLFG